jgi:Saccharopine dehydrogenase NADP binding domain
VTGSLVVNELIRQGKPIRVGGRDVRRLSSLLDSAPGAEIDSCVVDVTEHNQLATFMSGLDAVISCVGPFERYGDAVVAAAASAGVPYTDSTGELNFVERVLQQYGDARSAIVPAGGCDGIVGDLLATAAARHAQGPIERVEITYRAVRPAASRGTVASALLLSRAPNWYLPYRARFPGRWRWAFPTPVCDTVLVARRFPAAEVVVGTAGLGGLAFAGMQMVQPLPHHLTPLVQLIPHEVPIGRRKRSAMEVVAKVMGSAGGGWAHCYAQDPYRTTARFLVETATRLPDIAPGAHASGEVLDPHSFFEAVSDSEFTWEAGALSN